MLEEIVGRKPHEISAELLCGNNQHTEDSTNAEVMDMQQEVKNDRDKSHSSTSNIFDILCEDEEKEKAELGKIIGKGRNARGESELYDILKRECWNVMMISCHTVFNQLISIGQILLNICQQSCT